MVRGLYSAAAGMMAQQVRVDVIANNLANVDTPGYKRDMVSFRTFPEMLISRLGRAPKRNIGSLTTGSIVDEITTSYRPGPLRDTGSPLDLALLGNANAFFVVRTPEGELCCTRQGSFTLDGNRRLVTTSGCAVLGLSNGQLVEIYLPGELQVNGSGLLTGAINNQGELVERLALVEIPAGQALQKIGNSLYRGEIVVGDTPDCEVRQGYLEGSNVEPLTEMVSMMAAMRLYEANQRVIQATDSTLGKAIEVGQV
ncbi:MAG: flagellar hook-basal body protein [Thermacetogeniaceae bacterium]|jgi:flagellar basal-body rod protein FlgF